MLSCFIILWSFVVSWIPFCALFEFQFYLVLFYWVVWCGVLHFGDVISSILFWVVFYCIFFFCGELNFILRSILFGSSVVYWALFYSALLFYVLFYTTVVLYHIWICWVVFCPVFLLCCALFFVLLNSVQSYVVLFLIANHWALVFHLMFGRL